ncbi:MAG: threonine--tRNA ligase, partial [Patescibacteria group bacterium]
MSDKHLSNKPLGKNDPQYLEYLRHSCAHLLAAAVIELWPDTKRTIGPAIENGFYFDFEFSHPVSEDDFPKIEQKMRELVKTWRGFQRQDVSAQEAKAAY